MSADYDYITNSVNDCFNSEQKREYLQFVFSKIKQKNAFHVYISIFLRLSKYEKYYNNDILDMSKNKMAAIFEMIIISRAMYTFYCSILNDYYSYFSKDFNKVRPAFEELEISNNMESRYLKDYNMLLDLVEKAFPLSEGSLDEFRRLVIILCFLGFKKSEIKLIKKTDVDFIHNTISLGEHIIENVPEKCMKLCRYCIDMDAVYLNNTAKLPYNKRTYLPLYNNDYLIRARFEDEELQNNVVSDGWLGRIIVAFNKANDGYYSFSTIRASGLYAWLYHKEKMGEFDPNQTHKNLEGVYQQFFKTKCNVDNLSNNYKIWKQIFYGY